MRTIKIIFIALIPLLIISSCNLLGINGLFEKGYRNDNGQYVPKNPNFKLKDKPNNVIPSNLDFVNIYRLHQRYYQGKIHPSPDDKNSRLNSLINYKKFYSNGRCLNVVISAKDELGNPNQLKESNLDPNNTYCSKEYYHSKDGKEVYNERFVYGEGYGMYIITSFVLNKTGDTLTIADKKGSKTIYVKEKLPINWKKYKVDW
ncbi:MAG: hypothetical protein L3J20_09160 [Flavobacteriaceae bacterium]|nr:hypothetical protein [Flavobacteriaceae bacterium]